MTAIEMMVVVGLIGVILPTIYATVDAFGKESSAATSRLTAEGDVQIAMNRLTRELRAAVPVAEGTGTPLTFPSPIVFTVATATSMTFYASLGGANGPSKIAVSLVPVGSSGSTSSSRRPRRPTATASPRPTRPSPGHPGPSSTRP